MCTMFYTPHACGCQKDSKFVQCEARQGTNVRCSSYARQPLSQAGNYCENHLVKDTAPIQMRQ
ncbi:uncharacterized protein F5891DRAFT_1054111 [Suillus fuscotomentosus]|uniref:Uncharacterized protein n=1 Tax=Suillus fuscotomentosus TaxID=1912939 RepID=A0AAD4DYV1_9AGAM|nr:uncharacterized protein F5891DRAFT_1054111 [Suillus fuscotomentosus]KAG1896482.1 hypothetical protein F5891DRAFT_1054111 [Suillus fuscotomentosus]